MFCSSVCMQFSVEVGEVALSSGLHISMQLVSAVENMPDILMHSSCAGEYISTPLHPQLACLLTQQSAVRGNIFMPVRAKDCVSSEQAGLDCILQPTCMQCYLKRGLLALLYNVTKSCALAIGILHSEVIFV